MASRGRIDVGGVMHGHVLNLACLVDEWRHFWALSFRGLEDFCFRARNAGVYRRLADPMYKN